MKKEEFEYSEKMKFFEVPLPDQDYGYCSDNDCPCHESKLKRGEGYLYITPENVKCRSAILR